MKDKQKEDLKIHIKNKIAALNQDIRAYEESSKPVAPDNAIGRLSRMDAMNSRSMSEAALNRAKTTLAKLERVLARIDSPDFGLCSACEEPIPFKRLMAMPEAHLCVSCAQAMAACQESR